MKNEKKFSEMFPGLVKESGYQLDVRPLVTSLQQHLWVDDQVKNMKEKLQEDIMRTCLDKQRVKELLLKFFGYSNPLVDIGLLSLVDTYDGLKSKEKLKKEQKLFEELGL